MFRIVFTLVKAVTVLGLASDRLIAVSFMEFSAFPPGRMSLYQRTFGFSIGGNPVQFSNGRSPSPDRAERKAYLSSPSSTASGASLMSARIAQQNCCELYS